MGEELGDRDERGADLEGSQTLAWGLLAWMGSEAFQRASQPLRCPRVREDSKVGWSARHPGDMGRGGR